MELHWILLFAAVILIGLIAWHSSSFSVSSLKKIFERRTSDESDAVLGLGGNEFEQDESAEDDWVDGVRETPRSSHTNNFSSPIFCLNIKAPEGQAFSGTVLESRFRAAGLYFGDLNIFHYEVEKDGDFHPVFSLVSAFEPGCFDMKTIHQYTTAGLTLFMEADKVDAPREIFELMLKISQKLAADLQGIVCDEKWIPLTDPNLERYYARLGG